MITSRRNHLILALLFAASLACAIPSIPASNTNEVSTAAAQTALAGLREVPSATFEMLPTLTFTPTVTSIPLILESTITPSLTFTPYSILPDVTSTLIAQQISVSAPTNCRRGPGKAYEDVGALLVGETTEAYGRDPTSEYIYVRNPDAGVEFCWVWGKFATLSDSLLVLPVLMPPPTPSQTLTPTPVPSFDMEFIGYVKCTGWRMKIQIRNTSSQPFKSMAIVIKDETKEVELTANADAFTELNGCPISDTRDTIKPGDTFIISSPQFADNPKGHQFRAFITLCVEKGWTDGCVTRKLNFKP